MQVTNNFDHDRAGSRRVGEYSRRVGLFQRNASLEFPSGMWNHPVVITSTEMVVDGR